MRGAAALLFIPHSHPRWNERKSFVQLVDIILILLSLLIQITFSSSRLIETKTQTNRFVESDEKKNTQNREKERRKWNEMRKNDASKRLKKL